MRSGIALLLIALVGTAGCDRQSPTKEQANATTPAPAASDEAQDGSVDRSHAGETPPDVAFTTPDGKSVQIADFRGKPVLVNLWATWCAPCVKEMPSLDALAKQMGDRIAIVPVSQDIGGAKQVRSFFATHHLTALKPYTDEKLALSTAYGANLPTTIFYDAHGKEVWRVAGAMDWTSTKAKQLVDTNG